MNNSSNKRIGDMPQEHSLEKTYKIAKAGISAIPCFGGTAAELIDLVIAPQLSKRKDKWLESIALALNELYEKLESFDISKLLEDEEFLSVFLEASAIFMKTHLKEKHEMLTNAVCNSVCQPSLEYNQRKHFISLIEEFSLEHILILKYLKNPPSKHSNGNLVEYPPNRMIYERDGVNYTYGSAKRIIEIFLPNVKLPFHYKIKIFRDLAENGLIHGFVNKSVLCKSDLEPGRMSANIYSTDGRDLFEYYVTATGIEFLGYIYNSPIND